jgi:type II secretory ATPase GspE/PulE/Tfp pilus assembly ATPase PilB-like protein
MCFQTGYHGRIGIFELLEMNKEIHDLVLSHASSEEIRSAAEKYGFENMIVDGVNKIFTGQTTFDEVIRTTRSS